MSVCIYVADNNSVVPDISVASFFGEKERLRILNIKNEKRKIESLSALVALKKLCAEHLCSNKLSIERLDNGRPFFFGREDVDFNISHSGCLSLAALAFGDDRKVGIDIECVDQRLFATESPKYKKIADRFFSDEEIKRLDMAKRGGDLALMLEFYKIWTSVEASAKLSGVGVASSIGKELYNDLFSCHFVISYFDELYVLSVCTDRETNIEILGDSITLKEV